MQTPTYITTQHAIEVLKDFNLNFLDPFIQQEIDHHFELNEAYMNDFPRIAEQMETTIEKLSQQVRPKLKMLCDQQTATCLQVTIPHIDGYQIFVKVKLEEVKNAGIREEDRMKVLHLMWTNLGDEFFSFCERADDYNTYVDREMKKPDWFSRHQRIIEEAQRLFIYQN